MVSLIVTHDHSLTHSLSLGLILIQLVMINLAIRTWVRSKSGRPEMTQSNDSDTMQSQEVSGIRSALSKTLFFL